jgi:hypothetical protein
LDDLFELTTIRLSATTKGMVTKNVEPLPFSDFKVILPPSNCVFSLDIESPSPSPS